ncbi:MAG: hypothetical protein IRZ08_10115 [Frankia sp.]|nr:hypothetical protein [Frankia sp.]
MQDESGSVRALPAGPAGAAAAPGPGGPEAEQSGTVEPRAAAGRRLPAWAGRHAVFLVVLAVGAALRLAALYAYRPVFEFSGDSYAYLTLSRLGVPDPVRPAGYPLLLRLLSETGTLLAVPVTQHGLGLLLGVALYALLVHRQVHPVAAALAAAPVLLDAYQIVLEHFVMAETLFLVLLVAALVALLWSPRPPVWACALAGLLLGAAALVRTLGVVLAVLVFGYLVVRRFGLASVGAFAALLAAPLVGYASWFHDYHGRYALTAGDAGWLYGRVAPIARCELLDLTAEERILCSQHLPRDRPGPNYYVWDETSPRFRLTGTDEHRDAVLSSFARKVILAQPGDYARMVAAEIGHYFAPGRHTGYRDWPDGSWRFPDTDPPPPQYWHVSEPLLDFEEGHPARQVREPLAGMLRGYQRFGYTPGPLLAVLVVLGLAATLLALPRARGGQPAGPDPSAGAGAGAPPVDRRRLRLGARRRPTRIRSPLAARLLADDHRADRGRRARPRRGERGRLGADCALLVALGLAVLAVPSATVCFDYRYLLPVLVLFPPAAALALRQFTLTRATPAPARPDGPAEAAPAGDDVTTGQRP